MVSLGDHGRGAIVSFHVVQVGHHLAEDLLRLLVQVGNDNAGGQDGVV